MLSRINGAVRETDMVNESESRYVRFVRVAG